MEEDERLKRQRKQAEAVQMELANSEDLARRQREAQQHREPNRIRQQESARRGTDMMDFGGVDQRGNPTAEKALPPSTPPPTKKKVDPAQEKKRAEAKEKERQRGNRAGKREVQTSGGNKFESEKVGVG